MGIIKVVFGFLIVVLLAQCKDDKVEPTPPLPDNYLKINMQPMYANQNLFLDTTYITPEGYDVQFTDIKCYFSDLAFNGIQLKQSALFDFRTNNLLVARVIGEKANFAGLNLNVGITSVLNHADPTLPSFEDPLNIAQANDMHWGWNPGYIFLKIEAKVDTINDGIANFDHQVVFHIGKDAFLQTLSFPVVNWTSISATENELLLKLDMQKFLSNASQPIDLKTEYSSHSAAGQDAISIKVIQNFKDAISLF